MVSDEANLRTQLFSLFIFMTEKANEMVTASGRPSGIAMTITVTAVIRAYKKSVTVSPSHCLVLKRTLSATHLEKPNSREIKKNLNPIFAS
jgi:hypothetical protein